MSSPYVHQYLWRDHTLPVYRQLVLTFTDAQALAFLAALTALIAYTQSRVWKELRGIVFRFTTSVALPDDSIPGLSQSAAVKAFFRTKPPGLTHFIPYGIPMVWHRRVCKCLAFLAYGIVIP